MEGDPRDLKQVMITQGFLDRREAETISEEDVNNHWLRREIAEGRIKPAVVRREGSDLEFTITGSPEFGQTVLIGALHLDDGYNDGNVWIKHIEVDERFRRMGFATRLMRVALDSHGKKLKVPMLGNSGINDLWVTPEGRRFFTALADWGVELLLPEQLNTPVPMLQEGN